MQNIPIIVPQGHITGRLHDLEGNLLETFEHHVDYNTQNLIVRRAAIVLASSLRSGANQSLITHMAVGTGSATPVVADTVLDNEISRVAVTFSFVTTGTGVITFADGVETLSNKLKVSGTFGTSVVGNLTELGLFADGSGTANSGLLFCRKTFPAWNKTSSGTLSFDWVLSF